jgi:hypothetical protein
LHCSHQACPACPYDHDIKFMVHNVSSFLKE